jgi:6-phospho-3-hexuloisomerase
MKDYRKIVLDEINRALPKINIASTQTFALLICKTKRIYITGVGRSGLVVKAFGQRLMHLGFEIHLADEISAPAIAKGDMLIACSGTGDTELTVYMAKKAKKIGAKIVVLTARPRSRLARYASLLITIPTPLERRKKSYNIISTQPARSLFEQVLFLYLESLIIYLIEILGVTEKGIKKRHANLE